MSRSFRLPSGETCTRYYNRAQGGVRYALHGTPVVLSREDIEHLYAESIASDGGRELPESWSYSDLCACGCTRGMHGGDSPEDTFCEVCMGSDHPCEWFKLRERRL